MVRGRERAEREGERESSSSGSVIGSSSSSTCRCSRRCRRSSIRSNHVYYFCFVSSRISSVFLFHKMGRGFVLKTGTCMYVSSREYT
jgi:hypothetical protein